MEIRTKFFRTSSSLVLVLIILAFKPFSAKTQENVIAVTEKNQIISIENGKVRIIFDLFKSTYHVIDLTDGTLAISDAHSEFDGLGVQVQGWTNRSFNPDIHQEWEIMDISDSIGKGKKLSIFNKQYERVEFFTTFTLYEGKGFIVLGGGVKNRGAYSIRVKTFQPLTGGNAYPDLEIENPKNLNGGAGSSDNKVKDGMEIACENSLLFTFTANNKRHSLVVGGLSYCDFAKYAALGKYECWDTYSGYWHQPEIGLTWRTIWQPIHPQKVPKDFPERNIQVAAVDPVGRLVDPGDTYEPDDLFYVDVTTADPFLALEKYGLAMRIATNANPNVYNNLTVCGWFSGKNNSNLLLEELDFASKLDMFKTIPVTVRLEPDTYCKDDNGNTEQGWWDDEHWAKYRHLLHPYNTFRKWVQAVKEHNGNAETYFQCGMPSDDYAETFPEYMLGNDISNLHRRHTHIHPLVTYDVTDAGFQSHMDSVWTYLRNCGLSGVKFDYPDIAWISEGGFDDQYATTTSAYRKWFQLCRDGLGEKALIHERALGHNCLDVTVGIVDLQRVWGDSDKFFPGMTSRCGLRWYKNRVVMNYYPDSKAFMQFNNEGRRINNTVMDPLMRQSVITMLYVTGGRIELATSLKCLTPDVVYDLGRAFPMHSTPQSARPADAFTGVEIPRIYSFVVDKEWQQVTFYNPDKFPQTISAPMSGDQVLTGSLNLDPGKNYYVYDFWHDSFIGEIQGSGELKQQLEAGEARMLSVREKSCHPQVLSTNRHLMQGYVDLDDVKWDSSSQRLSGVAKVVRGETFRIVIANNKHKPIHSYAKGAKVRLEKYPANPGLCVLEINRDKNVDVPWYIKY